MLLQSKAKKKNNNNKNRFLFCFVVGFVFLLASAVICKVVICVQQSFCFGLFSSSYLNSELHVDCLLILFL
jgi:hypothetical protein